ncbi:MAG: D-aminoacylase [Acidobacteria bacterium]|nr:D-aminoacylase [Acidobacteriota bacterium]
MIRAAALLAFALQAADFDVLITNARVVDGAGNPWYKADIGVTGGRIQSVGNLKGKTAGTTIDAANRVVTPGFIDVHTHVEGAVELNPMGANYLLDGVTTIVTGNCGGSRVNLREWFERLEKIKLGLNLATLIGHNSVRSEVMGRANRLATDEEIVRMQALVDQAMRDGAVGFSTGLIYIPGTYSDTREVVALAKAASRHNAVYASHMRDEGAKVKEAIDEAVTVGEQANLRVQISHFKIDTPRLWGMSKETIALVEQHRARGIDVVVDQYPYDHSSTNLGITLPSWALADGQKAIDERLANSATRARIAAEMRKRLEDAGRKDYSYATVANYGTNPAYNGKNISEINQLEGREAGVDNEIETIFAMIVKGGAQMVYHSMGMEDVERILRYPNTAIASDGGIREFGSGMPHPRSYGTNARVLAEFVRKRGTLTLEDAVRRMTSLPARTFRFTDRGLIREGFVADLLVFDPANVRDLATYPDPHHYSEGFDYVLVNGVPVVAGGKLQAARPGRILRHKAE